MLGVLPVAQFSSGHTYFVQRMGQRLGLPQYAVHATFQYSGTPGKRHRMRERLLWTAVSPDSRVLMCSLWYPQQAPVGT